MLDMRRFEKQWRAKAKDVNFSFSLIIADLLRLMQSHVDFQPFDTCNHLHFSTSNFPLCADPPPWHERGCEYNAPSGTEVHVNNRVSASDPKSQPLRLKFMKHMPFGAQHQLKWFSWSKTPKHSWFLVQNTRNFLLRKSIDFLDSDKPSFAQFLPELRIQRCSAKSEDLIP